MKLLPACLILLSGCTALSLPPPLPAPAGYVFVEFDREGIVEFEARGLADRARHRALTIDDPVRIASVSKLAVALGVLRLVEADTLDLDRDVSDWLGWKLRNPAFPDRPISLRMLMSHRSGLRDAVDYAIPLGSGLQSTLSNPLAFDRSHPPGEYFTYSNLNFPVVATVMEAATGERFDLLMRALVLDPLGLDACFNWPTCSDAAVARAVVLYGADGKAVRDDLGGQRPLCPVVPDGAGGCDWQAYRPGANGALFSPQGGLRISARDLAAIGRLLLNKGRHEGRQFLSEASMRALGEGHWRFDGANGDSENGFYCGYGLALQLLSRCPPADDLFGDGAAWQGHAGEAYGVRSGVWIDAERGVGVAFFATGIAERPPRGRSSYTQAEEWLARRIERKR
jgi:CubicO group peptidase (beta-lactamase class C family)